MVVNDLYRRIGRQPLGRGESLRIYQNDLRDRAERQIRRRNEGEFAPIEAEEIAQVAVELARQHCDRVSVQFGCGQQGGERVEICVLVAQNEFHSALSIASVYFDYISKAGGLTTLTPVDRYCTLCLTSRIPTCGDTITSGCGGEQDEGKDIAPIVPEIL